MTVENAPPATSEAAVPVPVRQVKGDVITYFEAILTEIPDAGGEGVENILEQIAAANDVTGLDEPWRAGGLGKYVDRPLRIDGIRKLPSDFGSGLSYFLVVDGADLETGEKVVATTGSMSVVGQLAKAWALGAFPCVVIPRLAKRKTKDGFYPQHLEFPQP